MGTVSDKAAAVYQQTARFNEAKGHLLQSSDNLSELADYCDAQYDEASSFVAQRKAFEDSKLFAIQALGSLAYQLNESSSSVLGMFDVVAQSCKAIVSTVSHINIVVEAHKGKVAKREAACLCVPKRSVNHQEKMHVPFEVEVPIYPGHKRLNSSLLDGIGFGPCPTERGQSPYALSLRDVTLAGDTPVAITSPPKLSEWSSMRPQSRVSITSGWADRDTSGFFKISSPCPPTAASVEPNSARRPRMSEPACLSPTCSMGTPQRPRSSSLNDVTQLQYEVADAEDGDSSGHYDSIHILTTQHARKPRASKPPTALQPPQTPERSRSLSWSGAAENDSIYANWPVVRKDRRRQAPSMPIPPPPTNPPPSTTPQPNPPLVAEDNYISFSASACSRGGEELLPHSAEVGVETIEYESFVYDQVKGSVDTAVPELLPSTSGISVQVSQSPSASAAAINASASIPDIVTPCLAVLPPPPPPPSTVSGTALALYDYTAADATQLSLQHGEVVHILQQVNNHWYLASNSTGCKGLVPSSYVELRVDNASPLL